MLMDTKELKIQVPEGYEIDKESSTFECIKFRASWYKKEKFDPKTLQPFDRVLVRDRDIEHWICSLFSHIINDEYLCIGSCFKYCIPYNDDTKHIVGTKEEAPEYYRYWED